MSQFLRDLAARGGVIGEIFAVLWRSRRWWLIPMIVTLLLIGGLIALSTASGWAPFIYTLF